MKKNELNLIQWHEGMLLSPQHFQQSNNYFQLLISKIGAASNNFFYGVNSLDVDTAALSAGVIRVLKTEGFFQDGCYFKFDAVYDKPLEKDLRNYVISNDRAKIYLAIPKNRIGEDILSGQLARYFSDELENVADSNTGNEQINIPILKPNLKLLLENEIDERYSYMPIVEIEKSINSGIGLSKFIPPYITLDEHNILVRMCRNLAQLIRNKISYFVDRKDSVDTSSGNESMHGVRILIQSVLQLESIIKISGIQPFEIFKILSDSVAKIISINPTQLLPTLSPYNHYNLYACFNDNIEYATNILNELKQEYKLIIFDREENIYKLQINPQLLNDEEEIVIGIKKKFSSTNDEILHWIKGLQIASESMLPLIKDRRVLGAERRILERGEYITQPTNIVLLAIKAKTSYIKSNEKLCLLNMANVALAEEVILYASK